MRGSHTASLRVSCCLCANVNTKPSTLNYSDYHANYLLMKTIVGQPTHCARHLSQLGAGSRGCLTKRGPRVHKCSFEVP